MTAATAQPPAEPRYEHIPFYTIKETQNGTTTRIDLMMLIDCYYELGFRRLDVGGRSITIRIQDNVIEQISDIQLMEVFKNYCESFGEMMPDGAKVHSLLNKYFHQMGKYTNPKFLAMIGEDENMTIQRDTLTTSYFFYQNGFVEVTKDGIELKPYSQLEGKVWRNQILPRNFDPAADGDKAVFHKYVSNISDNWKERFYDQKKNSKRSPERFRIFRQMIGKAMHNYLVGKMKMVLLTDSKVSLDASGRTGKTLLMKAIGHMLNANPHSKCYVEISGKQFDLTNRFKWQKVDLETTCVHINDMPRNFDVEGLFDAISEGIEVEQKNGAPYTVVCNIYGTTNRTIRIEGPSAKDRTEEFENADYYTAGQGPDVEFGHWFFRDWDRAEWAKFDAFMVKCAQLYLQYGLQRPDSINLEIRKMMEQTCEEWVEFMDGRIHLYTTETPLTQIAEDYVRYNPDAGNLRKLTRIVSKYFATYGEYHPLIREATRRKSNGSVIMSFKIKKGVKLPEQAEEDDNPFDV